jgi:hypothetical protein
MTALDKENLKDIVRELMQEDKEFLKDIIREIILEETNSSQIDRKAKIDTIIKRDFRRYENVFKALA